MNMILRKGSADLYGELEEIRLDIDRGHSASAQRRLSHFLGRHRHDAELTARGRCLLSESLELQGRHAESVENLREYEIAAHVGRLEVGTRARIRARLALAYNYTGDFPKAIALLTSTLRELRQVGSDGAKGSVYLALSRIYRTINEYPIARDHAVKALEYFRRDGDWRGLAESYFAVALVELFEGEYEPALAHLEQVPKLVGENPAAYLLGMTYTNLAAVCGFVRQPREGIAHLEKAISYYETTEHTTNAIAGYNNLGVHLMLLGEWDRAEQTFRRALELAESTDARSAKLPMVLDSLGELKVLRGELAEARELLEKSVRIAAQHQNKWYEWQSLRTLGKCALAEGRFDDGLKTAREILRIGRKIGDRQAVREAHLLIVESYLAKRRPDESRKSIGILKHETLQSNFDLGFAGELQHLEGIAAMLEDNPETARQHFGTSISIFEILGDRYRSALGKFWLGAVFAATNPAAAAALIDESIGEFSAMGAKPDLDRAIGHREALPGSSQGNPPDSPRLLPALVTRLADASVSPELLIRELVSALRYEAGVKQIAVQEIKQESSTIVAASFGMSPEELKSVEKYDPSLLSRDSEKHFVHDFSIGENRRFRLFISPASDAVLPGGLPLDPLLRVVGMGLGLCAAREKPRPAEKKAEVAEATEIESGADFIYASPAMESLVEEIRKIRSSDVTVLITGESGTGKELVAQSVHQHSGRGNKSFVPFNCTAVPKELADAYLFGYRKGAFTGAATDSEGVIRAAAGGTLFLDEVGDLPLDIQPKLLRFLQEGEIQPLGESKPVKTDVRIVAATNADLEQMVADGLFREDLYYRLNVIRLHVPPLRERRSEIPALVAHYCRLYSDRFGRRNVVFSPQAVDLLSVCDWQGNIRQLCNEIQRIIARADDDMIITPAEISPEVRPHAKDMGQRSATNSPVFDLSVPLHEAVEELERRMIEDALTQTSGNVSRASALLGLTRRGLQMKMVRYGFR